MDPICGDGVHRLGTTAAAAGPLPRRAVHPDREGRYGSAAAAKSHRDEARRAGPGILRSGFVEDSYSLASDAAGLKAAYRATAG